ncbi:Sir2 family NAD-dependent protein deacetylase [Vibrio sp. D431a]|uniref:SIR2 family NAD-dependent protein deacylase n=1 Tax=Vibrio sp. D431a TaxID=2837388 RepID=UPI002555EAD2|nr:Sir2 family NAD-dependent protein deacetylase [Vibrio sp. D431a]MDK9790715.1 hypothetical protein [Vibrio sp. D431a]
MGTKQSKTIQANNSAIQVKSGDKEITLSHVKKIIHEAKAAFVFTGAGMSASCGLPTFRGKEGFWNHYPPYRDIGISFYELATPNTFEADFSLALGFYGSRLQDYKETKPHVGYKLINDWLEALPRKGFIKTSNVDGLHFHDGYDRVHEIHGSINHWHCLRPECSTNHGYVNPPEVKIDRKTMRSNLPDSAYCEHCESPLRPAICMFEDWGYHSERSNKQAVRFSQFTAEIQDHPCVGVVLEIGAGSGIPSIRLAAENTSVSTFFTHIVINPEDDSDKYIRRKDVIYVIGDAEEAIIELLG